MKHLVIVPTYNEKENIVNLIQAINEQNITVDILVVDDSSPDGTGQAVESLQGKYENLNLMTREKKEGLGKAYLAGFQWGLDQGYDALVEMDADFSHRPEDLSKIIKEIANHDFVVGSRYVKGGGTSNWSFFRKLISLFGSFYSKMILGYPLNDWTGGFNAWKSPVLKKMGLENVKSEGYCFQIELKYRALKLGYSGYEQPILFEERRAGESKMSFKIVLEAIYKVWMLRFKI